MLKKTLSVILVVTTLGLTMTGCHRNKPPYISSLSGPSNANIGDTVVFTATAFDPNGDYIAYQFDWGDGDISNWSSLVASGASISMTHTYSSEGTYDVRTRAKDINEAESGWSSGTQINIYNYGALKWSYTTGGKMYSSPAIGSDGTIYVGSVDGKLYAISSSGNLKWSFATGGAIYSSPAIGSDGTIYVGSYDDKLYAINSDGTLKWSYTTGDAVCSSPAIASDGTIYVGSSDYKLYAIYGSGHLANTPWPMFHHDLMHSGRVGCP